MKRLALAWLGCVAVLMPGGCADPGMQADTDTGDSERVVATLPPETSTAQLDLDESEVDATEEVAVDAEVLLASTLESAKADNKRVLVHLGAPW